MIDIDHFKRYNDAFGHQEGDRCIKKVAEAISGCFDRTTDITARYGGEEFVVLLPNTSYEEMTMMAERVRSRIEGLKIEHDGNPPYGVVTCSLGAAYKVPDPDDAPELLLKYADEGLYKAKHNGRNQVQVMDIPDWQDNT